MDGTSWFMICLIGCFLASAMCYLACYGTLRRYRRTGKGRIFGLVMLAMAFVFSIFPMIVFHGDIAFKIILMLFNIAVLLLFLQEPE